MTNEDVNLIIERREECLSTMAERKPCNHDAEEVMGWYVDDTDILLEYIKELEAKNAG